MSERARRYLKRVDEHTREMPQGPLVQFLTMQRDHWEGLFGIFQDGVDRLGAKDKPETDACAEDYIVTIAGLDNRLAEARRALS